MKRTWAARPSDAIFEALRYDPQTGAIYRRDGRRADVRDHKYPRVYFEGRMHYAHRIAWLLAGNGWPETPIDHVNGDHCDNRLSNLRQATYAQNNWNSRGYGKYAKGVCFNKRNAKFQASIAATGKRQYLGSFETEAEAHAAYCAAAKLAHGEFARLS